MPLDLNESYHTRFPMDLAAEEGILFPGLYDGCRQKALDGQSPGERPLLGTHAFSRALFRLSPVSVVPACMAE